MRNFGLARTFPFTHRAIEVAMLISYRILCIWIDYFDVEKTDSNTAASSSSLRPVANATDVSHP